MNKQKVNIIFKAVGLAMGVATLVLSIMGTIEVKTAITLLSIGLLSLGISQLNSGNEN